MLQRVISSFTVRVLIFSSCALLSLTTSAQQKVKTNTIERDTIPLFRGIAVSTDLVGPAQLAFGDYGQVQASLRLNLKDKWFPIVELGYGKADAKDITTKMAYKTSAPYGRIGMDWNLSKNKHDIYRLYIGARYALTYYKFDVEHPDVVDPIWGGLTPFIHHNISAHYHWLEAVAGIDAKIIGPLRLGWTVRYKRRIVHNDGELGSTWYVPGYGRQGSSRLGGTFNIIFEL